MAKNIVFNQPLDQPHVERPGVMYREADAPGNGKWLSLEPDSPERAKKGDLGFSGLEPPRPLGRKGAPLPIKNPRSGK